MTQTTFQQMFPQGEENTAYARYFTGISYLAPLANGDANVANVTFEPGCRNFWHIHHGANQILICTAGEGWYQEAGKSAQRLKEGDVIDIPAGVKHWHGATKDGWFSHISVMVPKPGISTEWCEPVSDAEYFAVHG
ncbi:cupin domain-containing protein [Aggregatibacter kilianii]|uniref:cupin domain-containing protein n=1 Tax=Aggregatibacter kilianii TaxID=2025884 RepID=UPI000D64D85B|nr:cupin domain-containing protein [Aggregatibacter kilianii]